MMIQPEFPSVGNAEPVGHIPYDLRLKLASELEAMRNEMEEIGVSLCFDEEVMLRCLSHLQRLDELGQRSTWIADLVRSADPASRVADITLASLAERLRD